MSQAGCWDPFCFAFPRDLGSIWNLTGFSPSNRSKTLSKELILHPSMRAHGHLCESHRQIARGKHSCCPKYYRKSFASWVWVEHFQVLTVFLEGLSQGGFCSGSQVGRDLFHPSSPPSSPFPSPFPDILSLTLWPISWPRGLQLCTWKWKRYFKLRHLDSHLFLGH